MKKLNFYKIAGLIALSPLLLSCEDGGNKEGNSDYEIVDFREDDLPTSISLVGEKFLFEEITNPRNILLKDGFLIVSEKTKGDLLHIIDAGKRKYLNSTGKNGAGPGESSIAWKIEDRNERNKFWTYDLELKIFSRYDIKDSSKLADYQFKQEESLFMAVDMTWASDSSVMARMADGEIKYFEINLKGDTINTYGSWVGMIENDDVPLSVINSIHQGILRASPDKTRFINAGGRRDYIDIIDKVNGRMLSIRGPEDKVPDFTVGYSSGYPMPALNLNTLKVRYLDSFAGKNSLYGLYLGKSYREISNPDNLNRIFQFDYNGRILKNYALDFPLSSFTIDEEERIIYGITVDEDPGIVVFELPE